jgi:hypothetical protein
MHFNAVATFHFVKGIWSFIHIVINSVSNRSGLAARGPGMDRDSRLVLFQTCPKTWPADSWQVQPRPVPFNHQVLPSLAIPVGCNLWFCVSGYTFIVVFRYGTVNRKRLTMVRHGIFWTYWSPWYANWAYSCTLPHPENERPWSVNDFWSSIFANMSGAWSQASERRIWQPL